jgi:hypothetical protein
MVRMADCGHRASSGGWHHACSLRNYDSACAESLEDTVLRMTLLTAAALAVASVTALSAQTPNPGPAQTPNPAQTSIPAPTPTQTQTPAPTPTQVPSPPTLPPPPFTSTVPMPAPSAFPPTSRELPCDLLVQDFLQVSGAFRSQGCEGDSQSHGRSASVQILSV